MGISDRNIRGLLLSALASLAGCGVVNDFGPSDDQLSLEDDVPNKLKWSDTETVKGSKAGLTISGHCNKEVAIVKVSLEGSEVASANCVNGDFVVEIPAASLPSNGTYALKFAGLRKGSISAFTVVNRTYNLLKFDPSTLVTITSNIVTQSIPVTAATIDVTGTCLNPPQAPSQVTISIGTLPSFVCPGSGNFSETVAVEVGTSPLPISWTDEFNNSFEHTYSLVRQALNTPFLIAGMVSFTDQLASVTGGDSLTPTMAATAGFPFEVGTCSGDCVVDPPSIGNFIYLLGP